MTLLDDDIDDLLRSFRADEAVVDDATRTRVWARICAEDPDARAELDRLAPAVPRRRHRVPRARLLAVAAAVLVLLAVAGVAVRSGPEGGSVTAGTGTTEPLPRDLLELADRVSARPVTELGAAEEARYTHQRVERVVEAPGTEAVIRTEERWIAQDGTGRLVVTGDAARDETFDEPGALALGTLAPDVALALPDDAEAAEAALVAGSGEAAGPALATTTIETLAHAGLPAAARAGLLRHLDRLGFVPVPAPGAGPRLLRVEGPGPDGSTVQADLDLDSGLIVASASTTRQGTRDERTYVEADLRADTSSR